MAAVAAQPVSQRVAFVEPYTKVNALFKVGGGVFVLISAFCIVVAGCRIDALRGGYMSRFPWLSKPMPVGTLIGGIAFAAVALLPVGIFLTRIHLGEKDNT